MKDIILIICLSAPSIALYVTSAIMAFKEKEGWGWFLLTAFICTGLPLNAI